MMKMLCYAVQPGFAHVIAAHPTLLNDLDALSEEQCQALLKMPDEVELCERAIHYFHNDSIYLNDHTIYYENALKKMVYTIECDRFCMILSQPEDNPFLPFLRRIFRAFITCPQKESL